MLDALTTNKNLSVSSLYTIRSSIIPPDSLVKQLYCALPTSIFEISLEHKCCTNSREFNPEISNSPIWETSNIPTLFLT